MRFSSCSIELPSNWKWVVRGHFLKCGFVFGLSLGLLGIGLFNAAFCVPKFYADRLSVDDQAATTAGEQMSRKVAQFNTDITKPGEWQVEFTEGQINAWLANELLNRLPRALPPNVFDPRVALQPDMAKVAAKYSCGNLAAVLTLEVAPYVAGNDNDLAIRICAAKIGSVPGLADRARQSIHYASLRSRIRIRWQKEPATGDWIGRFKFDGKVFDLDPSVKLRQITLEDGAVRFRGETLARPIPVLVPPVVASLTSGASSATATCRVDLLIRPAWSDDVLPKNSPVANLATKVARNRKADQSSSPQVQR